MTKQQLQADQSEAGMSHDDIPPLHIDDWLDQCVLTTEPGEAYARWWLEQARFPAWKKSLYWDIMKEHKLFCTYKGSRFRVTGASRMGDIWIATDFKRENGYDQRVNVEDCYNWSKEP